MYAFPLALSVPNSPALFGIASTRFVMFPFGISIKSSSSQYATSSLILLVMCSTKTAATFQDESEYSYDHYLPFIPFLWETSQKSGFKHSVVTDTQPANLQQRHSCPLPCVWITQNACSTCWATSFLNSSNHNVRHFSRLLLPSSELCCQWPCSDSEIPLTLS